jgi:hypothetical protein
MSLVIKSWSVKSNPAPGEPFVKIVAREGGFWSFIFSLLGIDATTTMQVSSTRIEFEQGSLSGFVSRLTPFEHISSTFYGRHKPWKTALVLLFVAISLGSAFKSALAFVLMLLIGVVGSGLYYFLNRALMIGFNEDSGTTAVITFKRSVIEGQEIDEAQLRKIILIIENLIKKQPTASGHTEHIDIGGEPDNARAAATAPQTFREVMQGPNSVPFGAAAGTATPSKPVPQLAGSCPKCMAPVTTADVFCGGCGYKLK